MKTNYWNSIDYLIKFLLPSINAQLCGNDHGIYLKFYGYYLLCIVLYNNIDFASDAY